MKVNIDVSGLNGQKLTGVGVYVVNLIKALQAIKEIKLSASYRISRIKYRKAIQEKVDISLRVPYNPLISNFLPKPYSIFHGPDYWIPNTKLVKKVLTIHDLSVFHDGLWSKEFADYGKMRTSQMLTKHKPDQIIVVSDFVKGELLNRFPTFEEITTTVYHGVNHFASPLSEKKKLEFPYILCAGTIEVRKNSSRLAQAFDRISSKFPNLKLVFAGGISGYQGAEIAEEIIKIKNVIHLNYVDNETMQNLIQYAEFVAYPSVYEGFGFPILEAMNLGTPVLTSDFGAMKEVSDGKAFLANTLNVSMLAESMEELLKNETLRKKLSVDGQEYVKGFTWQKCAQETIEVYKKANEV